MQYWSAKAALLTNGESVRNSENSFVKESIELPSLERINHTFLRCSHSNSLKSSPTFSPWTSWRFGKSVFHSLWAGSRLGSTSASSEATSPEFSLPGHFAGGLALHWSRRSCVWPKGEPARKLSFPWKISLFDWRTSITKAFWFRRSLSSGNQPRFRFLIHCYLENYYA